jgi:hypothetical protein
MILTHLGYRLHPSALSTFAVGNMTFVSSHCSDTL